MCVRDQHKISVMFMGPFKCYIMNALWVGRVSYFPEKKRYEDVRFNVISITRGWVGVKFPEKVLHTVTLEWPLYLSEPL